MSKRQSILTCAIAAALTMVAGTGQAISIVTGNYYPSITITLDACNVSGGGTAGCMPDSSDPSLTDMALFFNTSITSGGPLTGPVDGEANDETVSVGPFSIPLVFPSVPTRELVMGILDYLPSDGSTPTDHVVMFVKPGSIATGVTWDSLFNNSGNGLGLFPEGQILQDLRDAADSSDFSTYINGVNDLFSFMNQDLDSSMFYAPDGGTMDALAFSTSTNIASGTSNAQFYPTVTTPEPAGWTLLAFGLGLLVSVRKLRALATQR